MIWTSSSRRPTPCAPRALLLLAAALSPGCGSDPLPALTGPDGSLASPASPDLSTVPPDLGGAYYHWRWSLYYEDAPASCAEAGITTVTLAYHDPDPHGGWHQLAEVDCFLGEVTVGPLVIPADHGIIVATARDAQGVVRDWDYDPYVNFDFPTTPGLHVIPASSFSITDEPIPEMRSIFEGARAWYKAHGTLPPVATWTPPGPGVCCAKADQLCVPMPELWARPPWNNLSFSLLKRHRFSYQFEATLVPLSFTIAAAADQNCDGVNFAEYDMTGVLAQGDFIGIDDVKISKPGE